VNRYGLFLPWPLDTQSEEGVFLPGSNVVYDFHGDPCRADLIITMEGNQFMAIPEVIQAFHKYVGEPVSIFYVTLPPPRFRPLIEGKSLSIGNLVLSTRPHVVMGPPEFMAKIKEFITPPQTFMENKGVVLVFKRGNPKGISSPQDLMRPEIKIAISNPQTEQNSYQVYLKALSHVPGLKEKIEKEALKSQVIHHREVPAFIYHGWADVAPLYFHFAYYYQNPQFFPEPLFDYLSFPEGEACRSLYQAALTKEGTLNRWAKAWIEFLKTDTVKKIYARHGFKK